MRRWVLVAATLLLLAARHRAVGPSDAPAASFRGTTGRTAEVRGTGVTHLPSERWSRQTVQGAFSVLKNGNRLFVNSSTAPGERATVVAIDANTGATLWSFRTRGRIASPGLVYRNLWILGSDDGLYALDVTDGSERWFIAAASGVWTAPLLLNGTLYFAETGGVLHAVDSTTRAERWRATIGPFPSESAVADGTLFMSAGRAMVALDIATGAERWRNTMTSEWMPHAVTGGRVFAGTADQRFFALSAASGETLWTHTDPPAQFGDWSHPAVANGIVYAANRSNRLYAFDAATGAVVWSTMTADRAAFPIVANGILLFGITSHSEGRDATIYAVRASTGEEIWRFSDAGLLLEGEPAVADGALYFVSVSGKLYALE